MKHWMKRLDMKIDEYGGFVQCLHKSHSLTAWVSAYRRLHG